MLPKKPKRTKWSELNVSRTHIEHLLRSTDPSTTMMPPSINFEDMDEGVLRFIEEDLAPVIDGSQVPVVFMDNERWAEFSKTWTFRDEDQNILTPLITLKRSGKAPGSHSGNRWNVPRRATFTYVRVPRFDGEVEYVDFYKVPQPVFVDLLFDAQIFSPYMEDINTVDRIMFTAFCDRQAYTRVKGHYMTVLMEDVRHQGDVEDQQGQRMISTLYSLRLLGFLQNPEEFEIVTSIKKTDLLLFLR